MKEKGMFYIIILILTGISCSTDSDHSVLGDFKKTVEVKLNNSKIESDDIGQILDMVSFDSLLIVNEVFREKVFKCYNTIDGSLVSNFINTGRGPNEIGFPGIIIAVDDSLFAMLDRNSKQMVYFNKNDIGRNFVQMKKIVNFNESQLVIFQCFPLNDSLFILTGIFDEGQYCIYNSISGKTIFGIDFPNVENHEGDSNDVKAMANQGEIAIKPDKKKFVSVYSNGYFDICSFSEDEIILDKRKLYFLSDYKAVEGPFTGAAHYSNSKYAFHSVEASDDYIYMIYSGKSRDEAGDAYVAGNNILVYDWDGNPVVNFKVDDYIHRMTLDLKNQIVYGFCLDSITAEPKIVTCQLPSH